MLHSRLRFWLLPIVLLLHACSGDEAGGPATDVIEVRDAGFESPSSIIHDEVADVYIVANLSGGPLERNAVGFISRVSPEGEVLEARWIQGVRFAVQLNAPQGMAIHGDSLFVADLDCIRIFHRVTGNSEGVRCLGEATSLTGLAMGPEGSLFVTDSGMEEGENGAASASGSDGIFRLVPDDEQRGATLARSPELGHPTGIAVGNRGIFVVTAGTGAIVRYTPSGEGTPILPAAQGRSLSGVVFLTDGGFAYASSSESSVFTVTAEGRRELLVDQVGRTGLLGYDATRDRLLVPVTDENRVLFVGRGGS